MPPRSLLVGSRIPRIPEDNRNPERMDPTLGCDDFLLDQSHKLLALRQGQTQIRDVAKITRAVDLHHVDASARPIDTSFHQAQNPPHS